MREELPATRLSLLVRIRDGSDAEAWNRFVAVYGPVVYGFARRRGLQDADAADLMQEVLRSVAGAAERLEYDPAKGTFRGWLFTVTRNKIFNFLQRQRRQPRGTGDSGAQALLEEHPGREPGQADEWERDYQQRVSGWAMDQVKGEFQPATWRAFWLTAVEGKPAKDAGEETGLSPGAVYVAKSRVLARLREKVQQFQRDEEDGRT